MGIKQTQVIVPGRLQQQLRQRTKVAYGGSFRQSSTRTRRSRNDASLPEVTAIRMSATIADATRRIGAERQSLDEAYNPPASLEIEVGNPVTHEATQGHSRFTDYEVRIRTNLPVFCGSDSVREFSCRRRYSDFLWLRNEIKRAIKQFNVPKLPDKAVFRQVMSTLLGNEDDLFGKEFIEERRRRLEEFIVSLAGHPLVQHERSLHMFLLDDKIDRDAYVPGKVQR